MSGRHGHGEGGSEFPLQYGLRFLEVVITSSRRGRTVIERSRNGIAIAEMRQSELCLVVSLSVTILVAPLAFIG
jgi:hypothetical protein